MLSVIEVNSRKDLKAWIQFIAFYQKFIPNFSALAAPLYRLTNKSVPFIWTETASKAMADLKLALSRDVILAFPNINDLFELYTDASDEAVGFVLTQQNRPLRFGSKMLNDAQRRYSTGDKEALAIITALEKFYPYLKGSRVIVYTDHKPLLNFLDRRGTDMTGREARYWEKMRRFDLEIRWLEGSKNFLADILSRHPKRADLNLVIRISGLSDFEISDQQKSCPEIGPLHALLSGQSISLPPKITAYVSNLSLSGNILYHLWSPHPGAARSETILQVATPIAWRANILLREHDKSGHFSASATYDRVRKNFWWPNMFATIKEYVDACSACTLLKSPVGVAPMQVWSPSRFNQRVAFDICGPYPSTAQGNKYVLVHVECFSKWIVPVALSDIKSATVYKAFLDNYVYVFGPPEELLSDRAANLISELAQNLCEEYGIRKIQTTAEHPQADPAERAIKTFKSVLHKLLVEFPSDWDIHIQKVAYAIRTKTSRAHDFTPFEIVFPGRKPVLPSYLEYPSQIFENPSVRSDTEQKIFAHVRDALQKQAENNKIAYDNRSSQRRYDIIAGDHVMLSTIRSANSLDTKLRGPYLVESFTSETTVHLASLDGSKLNFHPVVHINHLRKVSKFGREERLESLFHEECPIPSFVSPVPSNIQPVQPPMIQQPPAQLPVVPVQDFVIPAEIPPNSDSSSSVEEVVQEIVHHEVAADGYLKFKTYFEGDSEPYWLPAKNFLSDNNRCVNHTFQEYITNEGISLEEALRPAAAISREGRNVRDTNNHVPPRGGRTRGKNKK